MIRLLILASVATLLWVDYSSACIPLRKCFAWNKGKKESSRIRTGYTAVPESKPVINSRSDPVTIRNFTVNHAIANGGYSTVYVVTKIGRPDNGKIFAMKAININNALRLDETRVSRDVTLNRLMNERNMLVAVVGSRLLIELKYAFYMKNWLFYITDIAIGGALIEAMQDAEWNMNEELLSRILAEAIAAIYLLHLRKIEHKDIKWENFFIDKDGHVKLGDLGSAERHGSFVGTDWLQFSQELTAYYKTPNETQQALIDALASVMDETRLFETMSRHSIFAKTNWKAVTDGNCPAFINELPSIIQIQNKKQDPNALFPIEEIESTIAAKFRDFQFPPLRR